MQADLYKTDGEKLPVEGAYPRLTAGWAEKFGCLNAIKPGDDKENYKSI